MRSIKHNATACRRNGEVMKAVSVKLLAVMAAGAFVFAACSSSDSNSSTATTKPAATTTTEAANKYKATADPTTNLVDGATVSVTVSGFTAGKTVGINECAQAGTSEVGAPDCNLSGIKIITVGSDGTGKGETAVTKGPVGENGHMCGTTGVRCFLSIGELVDSPDAERSDSIDITFTP